MKEFSEEYFIQVKEEDIFKIIFYRYLIFHANHNMITKQMEVKGCDFEDIHEVSFESLCALCHQFLYPEFIGYMNEVHFKEWLDSLEEGDFKLFSNCSFAEEFEQEAEIAYKEFLLDKENEIDWIIGTAQIELTNPFSKTLTRNEFEQILKESIDKAMSNDLFNNIIEVIDDKCAIPAVADY